MADRFSSIIRHPYWFLLSLISNTNRLHYGLLRGFSIPKEEMEAHRRISKDNGWLQRNIDEVRNRHASEIKE